MSEVKTDKVSSITTNGDLTLDPNGTGDVIVASGHKLGIGTAAPTEQLEISGTGVQTLKIDRTDASTDGALTINSANGSNYIYNDTAKLLILGTDNTERMRIDGSGNVLVNGTTVRAKFTVSRSDASSYNYASISVSNQPDHFVFYNDSTVTGSISRSGGSGVSYNTSSDHRLKENVADMTGAIDRVKALAPKRFNFIADDSVTVDGFIAHEAQTVVPEAVTGTHNEVDDDGNAVMQGIDQSKLVPLLTGALQEAITKIETLETQRADLETRVAALEAN